MSIQCWPHVNLMSTSCRSHVEMVDMGLTWDQHGVDMGFDMRSRLRGGHLRYGVDMGLTWGCDLWFSKLCRFMGVIKIWGWHGVDMGSTWGWHGVDIVSTRVDGRCMSKSPCRPHVNLMLILLKNTKLIDMGSTWGRYGVDMRSTWDRSAGSTWG